MGRRLGPRRVFYDEGMVTPMTGFLLLDPRCRSEWDVFQSALGHIILPGAHPRVLLGRLYKPHARAASCWSSWSQEYIIAARAKGLWQAAA